MKQYIADVLTRMGTVAFRMGDYHSSAFYQQSLALNREQGNRAGFREPGRFGSRGLPAQAARARGTIVWGGRGVARGERHLTSASASR